MQLEMQREVEERKRQKKEEEAKLRQDYIEKMKQATIIDEIDDKPAKKCKWAPSDPLGPAVFKNQPPQSRPVLMYGLYGTSQSLRNV